MTTTINGYRCYHCEDNKNLKNQIKKLNFVSLREKILHKKDKNYKRFFKKPEII